jgi:drug/metabolite transporter (DMT)-like permease
MRGAVFMTLAMGFFAIEDMALKAAAREIPIGQAVLMFGLAGLLVFVLWTKREGSRVFHPAVLSRAMIVRSVCEIGGRLFFALAIALTPLSSASAILQATPLVVAIGAVVFFGEQVGWRRWVAIAAGFVGVLIVLRPGLEGFEPASIFAVLGMLGFAGRDLATRASPATMTTAQLGVLGFVVLSVTGGVLLAVSGGAQWPGRESLWFVALATGAGVLAYSGLTRAMRTGEVSVVAPFRYSRLLFAVALGVGVFGETLDAPMMIGSAVIIGSGIFLLRRS